MKKDNVKRVPFKADAMITTKSAAILQAAKNTTHINDEYIFGYAAVGIWNELRLLFSRPENNQPTSDWNKFTMEYQKILNQLEGNDNPVEKAATTVLQDKLNQDAIKDFEDYLVEHTWADYEKYMLKAFNDYKRRREENKK